MIYNSAVVGVFTNNEGVSGGIYNKGRTIVRPVNTV
jgi:hypothetical protein